MVSRVRNAISALVIVQGTIVVVLIKSKVDHHEKKKKIETSRKASTSRQCRNVGHCLLNVTGSNSDHASRPR